MEISSILQKIRNVLPRDKNVFELHEPCFDALEEKYVQDCIQSRWVSYRGEYVKLFEEALADYCSVKHAISLVNGTTALYMALKVCGVIAEDEVIVPALTFVATANAVHHLGATPHFVDASYDTLGINIEKLEEYLDKIVVRDPNGLAVNKNTGRIIRAIVPVHVLGHPVDLTGLQRVAEKYHLPIVEDAAESLGSTFTGQSLGSFGLLSCLSFNGNKIITTGGGGAILTNSSELANKIAHLVTTAKQPHAFEFNHDEIGYNYRLPNINAAIGYAQMSKIDNFVAKKRLLAQRYQQALSDVTSLCVFTEQKEAKSNYWLNAIMLESKVADKRDQLLEQLRQTGIMCRPFWKPLHMLPMYSQNPRSSVEIAEDLYRCTICLPSSPFLVDGK